MILGYRLRELRKENKLSQERLGKILGVSKVSVSGYESGNRIPSLEILDKILNYFDVSADYLLGREINMVCEDDGITMKLSSNDLEIIRELHNNPILFNTISKSPKRFFNSLKNNPILP